MARALLLLALLAAAASSAVALSCGSSLTDVVMSGCNTCIEANVTRSGRRHGRGFRKLLHRGGDGPDGFGFGGSALVPSCTECDAGGNFVLVTRNESNPIGRCEVSTCSCVVPRPEKMRLHTGRACHGLGIPTTTHNMLGGGCIHA
jgi:hypothetical protein